jgi:hypothetical protein
VTTPTTVKVQLKLRQDTSSGWSAVNPILLVGELGRESNTGKIKIGDGSTAWNSLTYQPFGALITNDDISATAEIAVSKLADGAARQILQTDAAGTGVEWASNIDIPGTLDVTGAATFDATVTVTGDLTVNGTTTTISTQNLLVEDKNIIIGDVATPTDTTADGGGITLKGATDKTINWIDATDAWTSSERFSIPLGSAAAPSLTINGDANSGLYSPGADQVAISTNGTRRLIILSDGKVGLGAASVLQQGSGVDGGSGAGILELYNGGTGNTTLENTGAFPILFKTSGTERLRITSAGLVGVGTSDPTSGTSSYYDDLVVRNATSGTGAGITIQSNSTNGFSGLNLRKADGTDLGKLVTDSSDGKLYIETAGVAAITVDTSQRVGIGTSTVNTTLEVLNSSAPIIRVGDGTRHMELRGGSTTQNAAIGTNYAGGFDIIQNGSAAVTIDTSKRLLVGTSSWSANATLVAQGNSGGSASRAVLYLSLGANNPADGIALGNIEFSDSTPGRAATISGQRDGGTWTAGSSHPGRLVFSTTADGASSPTERMRIQSDGAINLKTSTIAGNDGVRFNVGSIVIAGSAWNSGAGTNAVKWSSVSGALTWDSSSRLVKEDIENCPYGLSELKMLKPRIYTRTDSGEKEIGFIADEVQSIIPEIVPTGPKSCITGNEDDAELIPISVNYDKFAAVLTKALQDAIGEIESLKARITALETP